MSKSMRLIQVGTFKKNVKKEDINGMDSIIEFKAMLYAEYEFGALPASLKRMTKNIDNMSFFTFTINKSKNCPVKKVITVYSGTKSEEEKQIIIDDIKNIGRRNLNTKGESYFSRYINSDSIEPCDMFRKDDYRYYDIWWDIENDFMFFPGEVDCEHAKSIKTAFEKLKEKWADELFPPQKIESFFQKIYHCIVGYK